MELNGKCKEIFDNWLVENHGIILHSYECADIFLYEIFYNPKLPDAMKFGVYQDFFDVNGIFIQVLFYDFDSHNWQIFIECEKESYDYTETHLTTRSEANSQAIKTANNLLNEQWKNK